MKITDRIQLLLVNRGIRPRDVKPNLARVCGISKQAVWQWFSGDTENIRSEYIVAIAKEWGTTTDWLLTGYGARGPGVPAEKRTTSVPPNLGHQFTTIELFDSAEAISPDASLAPDFAETVQSMTVSPKWLGGLGITFTNSDNLAVVLKPAESPSDHLDGADLLLVDRGVKEWKVDGAYIITLEGHTFVRRLQRLPGQVLLVIPDDPAYQAYPLDTQAQKSLAIHAKVLISWKSNKH